MDYNTEFQENNTELQEILDTVSELPTAGEIISEHNTDTNAHSDIRALIDDLSAQSSSDEIYVGSGDMPDGYTMQIDPSGEADNFATQKDIDSAIASLNYATQNDINSAIAALPTENWVFTLEDGTTVTKKVVVIG